MSNIVAIDLFSGAGGTTAGLKKAGIDVRIAVEIDKTACQTYYYNNPEVQLLNQDIREISGEKLLNDLNLKEDEKLILVACPPCQGFSAIRKNGNNDSRNMLIFEYLRLIKEVKPHYLLMENVTGLMKGNGKFIFESFLEEITSYDVVYDILNSADFGVPQTRKRLVLHGKRKDLVSDKIRLPKATHSKDDKTLQKWIDASIILDLPPLEAGETYISDTVFNHTCHNLSKLNKKRMEYIRKNGGSRICLPEELQLNCHKNYSGHTDVYGIIDINKPVSTITGGCMNYTKGRYGHPFENRALSAREAARLQTFEDNYKFIGNKNEIAKQIGNAVPVKLAYESAKVFVEIEGNVIIND